jgi:hypothetical protein
VLSDATEAEITSDPKRLRAAGLESVG